MQEKDTFIVDGEVFEVKYFPKFYSMFKHDPEWAEKQVKSIADVWHEGFIVSAMQAFESDL